MKKLTNLGLKGLILLLIFGCSEKIEQLHDKKLESAADKISYGWADWYEGNPDSSISKYNQAIVLLDVNNPAHTEYLFQAYEGLKLCYLLRGDSSALKKISEEEYKLFFGQ